MTSLTTITITKKITYSVSGVMWSKCGQAVNNNRGKQLYRFPHFINSLSIRFFVEKLSPCDVPQFSLIGDLS